MNENGSTPGALAARWDGWKVLAVFLAAGLVACSTNSHRKDPLKELQGKLAAYEEYTVTLNDMRISGNFWKDYEHQYRVLYGKKEPGSDDLIFEQRTFPRVPVSKEFYKQLEDYLGMVVLSKGADGKVDRAHYPAAYHYTGNRRYGEWRRHSSGGSFWAFYGQYRLLGDLFGMGRRPVFRSDYDSYRTHRSSRRPYYGPKDASGTSTYGTRGSHTKTSHPAFYQRQQARKQSFADRVKKRSSSRTSRSGASGSRSRSGGRGGK